MVTHIRPSRRSFTCRNRPVLMVQVTRFNVRNPTRTIQVPRAPLHARGVTSNVAVSRTASAGVTPPSSLIRTHAPDQNAPIVFGRPYSDRSLQLVVTHCCELALPDVISTIRAWALSPLPRSVSPVPLPVSSRRVSASPSGGRARHAK